MSNNDQEKRSLSDILSDMSTPTTGLDILKEQYRREDEFIDSIRKVTENAISMAREAIESGQDQDYDYASAIEYMRKTGESLYDISSGHWASRRPDTGQLLKSPEHETANLMYLGEIDAGNRIIRKGNREFSHKIHDLTDEQKLKYKQQIESGQAVTDLTGDGWRKPQAGQAHNQDRMEAARVRGHAIAEAELIPQFEKLMEQMTAMDIDIVAEAERGLASGFLKATSGLTAWFLDDFFGKGILTNVGGIDIEQVNEWAETFKAANISIQTGIRHEGFVGETAEMVAQSLPATAAGIGGALAGGIVGGPLGAGLGAFAASSYVGGAMGASAGQTRIDLYEHEVNAVLELNGLEPNFTVSTEDREEAINEHALYEAGFEGLGNLIGFGAIGKGLSKLSKTNRGKQFLSKSGRGALAGDMADAFARQASRAGLRGNALKMTPAFLANIATEGTTETFTEYYQTKSFAEIDPTAWETMDLAGAFGSGVLLSVIMSGPMTGAAATVDRMGTNKRRKQLEASLGISRSTQKTKSEFWQETYADTVEGLEADTPEGRQQTLDGWTEAEADAEAQIADLDKRINAALADGETTTAADLANQLQRKKAELEAIQINIAVTQEVMVGQDGAKPSVRKMTSQEVIDSDNAKLERNKDGSVKEPNKKKVVNNENLNKHEQRAQADLEAAGLEVVWYEGTDTPAFFRPETPNTVYLQRTNRSHHTALFSLGMHESVHRVQYYDPILNKALRDALGDGEVLLNAQNYIQSLKEQQGEEALTAYDNVGIALIHHLMQGKSLESFDIQTAEDAQIYLEQEGVAVAVQQAMDGVYGGTFGNILRRVGIGTKSGKATARFLNIIQQSARAKATEVGGRVEVTGDLGQRREERSRARLIQGGQAAQEAEALFDQTETLTPEEAASISTDPLEAERQDRYAFLSSDERRSLEARKIAKKVTKKSGIAPPPKIETIEELWAAPQQKITSEKTDLGTTAEDSTYLPKLFKNNLLDKVGLHFGVAYPESGMINANLASGKSNAVSRSFDEFGVTNYNYDPFLRDASENKEFVKKVGGGKADTATISNALNVIKESGARAQLIAQAANVIKEEGTAFFTVYEGDGTGVGKTTRAGYQTNRKLKSYIPEIEQYFETVQMRYGVIAATNPSMEARNLWTKTKQDAAVKAARTLVLNQVAPTEYLRGLAKNEEAFEKAGLLPLDFIDTEKVRAFKIPAIDAGYALVKEDLFTYKIVGAYNNEASVTAVMDTFVNHAKTLIDEGSLSLDGVKQEAVINQEIDDGVEVISLAEVRLLAEEETEASTPAEVAKLLSAVDLLPTKRHYDLEKQLDEMENEVPELRKAKEEVDELRLHKDSFVNHAKKTGLKSDEEVAEKAKGQWNKAKTRLDNLRNSERKDYAYTKEMDSVLAEMIELESEMYDKLGLDIPERGRKQRHSGTVLRERLDIRSQAILGKVKRHHKDKFIEEVMARAMVEELLWANAHGNWDASTWYASSIDKMWDAVGLLEPDLRKDSDHGIVLTLMLALQSNGEKVDRNIKLSLKAYRYWKRTGKFPPKSGQYRDVDFDKLQMLHNHFGSWKKLDKWLRQERLYGETKKEVKEMVTNNPDTFPPKKVNTPKGGLKGAWNLSDYLVKEMAWNAFVLGPKLGAFYLNNAGEFNPITQDLWFARTFYRLQGMQKNELLTKELNSMKRLSEEIAKVKESEWGTEAVAGFHPDMLKDIESLNSWIEKAGNEYAANNFKEKDPTKKEFYTIANGWNKLVKEDKKGVATATERGQAIRVVKEAVRIVREEHGIELNNASAQAMLWYFEKELYANMSSETTPFGQDFGTIADDLVKQEHFLKNRVDPTMAARSLNLVRDSRFGVGKRVGNNTYIEISYLGVLPQDAVDGVNRIKEEYDEDFKVVKYNTKTGDVSLIVSPEFDTVQEPKIEASVKYTKSTDTVGDRRAGSTVYHHKWLMVEDDYTGFDVKDSMVRTEVINKEIDRLSLSRNQIGSSKVWSTVLESLGSKPMEARRIESKVGPATYYPKLASILESLRQPKMPPDQLRNYLVGKGVSKQEMFWTGLDKFLDASTGSVLIEDAIQAVKPLKLHHVRLFATGEVNEDTGFVQFDDGMSEAFGTQTDPSDGGIEIAGGKTISAASRFQEYVPEYYFEREDIYGYSEHIIQWDATEFDLGVIETTQVRNNNWQTSRSQFLYTLVRHMNALNYSFSGGVWSQLDETLELVEQAAADASVQFEKWSKVRTDGREKPIDFPAEEVAVFLPHGINHKPTDFARAYIQLFYEQGTDWVKPLRDMKATNDKGVGPLSQYGKTQDTLVQEFATVIRNQMGKRLAKPSFLSAATRQEVEAEGYTYEPHSSSTGRVFLAYQQLMMGKEETQLEVTDALKKHTGLYYHAVRNNASPMDYIPPTGGNPLDKAFNFILRFADVSEAELLNQYSAKVKDAVGSAYQVVEETAGFTRHHWHGIDNALAHTRTLTMSVPRPDGTAMTELQVIEAQSDWANRAGRSPVMRNPWTLAEVDEVSKLHADILVDASNLPTEELNEAELGVRKTLDKVIPLSFDVDVAQQTTDRRFPNIETLHPDHLSTTLDVLNKLFLNRFYTLKASAKTEYARNSHPNHIESTSIDVADLLDSSFFNTPETTFSDSMLKELDHDPSKPYLFFNKDGETSIAYRLIEKGVFDFEYWTETDESGLYPVVQMKLTDLGKRFFDEIQNSYAYKAALMERHERGNTIPAGPFVIGDNLKADDAWHGLVVKQMIAEAVEQGADSLFWADLEFVNTAGGIEKSDGTSYAQQANILEKIAKKVDRDAQFTRVLAKKAPVPDWEVEMNIDDTIRQYIQPDGRIAEDDKERLLEHLLDNEWSEEDALEVVNMTYPNTESPYPEPYVLPPTGWRLEITDKIRESVREGMPMFGNTAMNARRDIGLKIAKTNASLRQGIMNNDPMHTLLADVFDLIPIQDYFDNGNDQFLKGYWEVEIEPLVSEYVHALDRAYSQNHFDTVEAESNDPLTQIVRQIAGKELTPDDDKYEVPENIWSIVAGHFPEPENKESTPIEVLLKIARALRLLDSMVDGIRVGGIPYKPMEDSVITLTDPKNTMDLLAGISAAKKEKDHRVNELTRLMQPRQETESEAEARMTRINDLIDEGVKPDPSDPVASSMYERLVPDRDSFLLSEKEVSSIVKILEKDDIDIQSITREELADPDLVNWVYEIDFAGYIMSKIPREYYGKAFFYNPFFLGGQGMYYYIDESGVIKQFASSWSEFDNSGIDETPSGDIYEFEDDFDMETFQTNREHELVDDYERLYFDGGDEFYVYRMTEKERLDLLGEVYDRSVISETSPLDESADETSSDLMNVLAKLIYAYPLGFGHVTDSTVNRRNPTGRDSLGEDALDTAVDRLNRERLYLTESDKDYLISVYERVHAIPERRRLLMPSLPYDEYQPVQQEVEGREPFVDYDKNVSVYNLDFAVDKDERQSLEKFLGFNLKDLPKGTKVDAVWVSSWDNRSGQSNIALVARTGRSGNYTSKVLALNPAGKWIPAQSFEHKHKNVKEGEEYITNFLKDRWFPVTRESAEAMSFVEVLKSDTEMRARKLGSRRRRTSILNSPALGMMMRDEEELAVSSPVQRDPFRAGFRAGARSLRKLRSQQEKEERKHAVETARSKARAKEARKLEAQRKRLESKLERVKAKALEAEKLRDTAIALVNLLPVKLRGKLATRLARVTTPHRLGKLAERAVQLAAKHEYRESVVRLRHVKRRLKKRKLGMSNTVREDINKKIREAERVAYQTGSTRMLPAKGEKLEAHDAYEISETVNEKIDEAIELAKKASMEYRASKEAKAERLGSAAFALIESLIKGKPRPLSRRGKRFNRKSKRWFRNTKTTITLVEELTRFASPEDAALIADILHHDLTNGESLSLLEMKRIFEEADRLARNAGYKSFSHLLDASGASGYGAVTETYNVVLGGEEVTVTLGELLKLYALDPETVDAVVTELDSDGNVIKKGVGLQFEEGRTVHPILNVTRQELLEATGQLTPQHKEMIHGLKSAREQLRDVAFKAYYDIHGTEPRFVEGYEPRSRERSAQRAEASLEVSSMTASFIDEAGYTKERTGGGQAIMVGNFVNDFISSSENLSKLAHMAVPVRNAISLINQREVKDAINTFLGADFHKDIENRLLHGAGMVQRQRGVLGIIGGNIARSYLTLNKQTWLRVLVGGVANLTIKLSPSDMLFGLASLGSVRRNLNEAWSGSGYLWARSLSGAMRRYTQETEQTAGRIADTASIMRSLEKIGKSLARAITEVSHGKISNAKEYASDIAKEIYGLPDTIHVMQLCDNLVTAVAYGAFRAKYARAGLTGGELIAAASKATESVMRTTQNTSSGLDATVLDANDAVEGKQLRALFPFVSDPITKANTVYTAIRYGTMKQKAIAAQGFVLANAINAGVTYAFGTMVELLIKSLGSDEEDERTREMLALLKEAEQIKLENRVRSNLIQGLLDQLGYAGVATGWLMGAFEGYGVDLPQLAAGEFDNLSRSLAGIVVEMTKEDTDWDKVEQHMWDASETLRIALGDPTVMPQRLAERVERGTAPTSRVLERSKRTIEKQTPLDFLFNQEPRKLNRDEKSLIKFLKEQEEYERLKEVEQGE